MAEIRILNLNQNAQITCGILSETGEDISKRLQKLMSQIKGQFMCDDGKAIDYNGTRNSKVFAQYLEECSRLVNVDLEKLTDQQKMSFFISIFCYLSHSVAIRALIRPSLYGRELPGHTAKNATDLLQIVNFTSLLQLQTGC